MSALRSTLLALIATLTAIAAHGAEPATAQPADPAETATVYWQQHREGWFWYRDPPPPAARPAPREPATPARPRELADFEAKQQRLETLKRVAVMNPTDDNLMAYMRFQRMVMDRSQVFADRWQRLVWREPSLDYAAEGRPTNTLAIAAFDDRQRERDAATVRQLAATHGLVFVFRSDCPFCHRFAPILKRFAQTHGLTVLAVGLATTPAVIIGLDSRARQVTTGLMAVGLLAGMALFGWQRIPAQPSPLVAGVKLRIMQPNLPQDDKFQPDKGREIVERYLSISDRATSPRTLGLQDVTHLIWPESAFPFLLDRTPAALQRISSALPRGVTLITGAARAGASLPGESQPPIFNAIQVITRDGGIVASYDKHHLVPFGEYLPGMFERLMHGLGLTAFVAIPGGFTASAARTVLDVPGLPPVAASICYEAIFPGEVLPQVGSSGTPASRRPQVLLNVTNDAWFGRTPGPYQHASQARLRAIEEGMPMVRAANNGVSIVVDAYGRVIASLPLGTDGVLDTGLPRAIGPTTFSRVGNLPAGVLMFICLVFSVAGRLRRRAAV